MERNLFVFLGGYEAFSASCPELCSKQSTSMGLSLPLSTNVPDSTESGCSSCSTPLYDQVSSGSYQRGEKQLTEAWESSASENRKSDLPLCVSRRVHRDIIYPMVKWSALAEPLNC